MSVWSTKSGKIIETLDHTQMSSEDVLSEVIAFDDRVVTVTSASEMYFWAHESPDEPFNTVNLSQYHKLVSTRCTRPVLLILYPTQVLLSFSYQSHVQFAFLKIVDLWVNKI